MVGYFAASEPLELIKRMEAEILRACGGGQ
jgi:hypothetical protein